MPEMTDEMLDRLEAQLRTRDAIRYKIHALNQAIVEALERDDVATAANLRSRRRVLQDRADAAKDAARIIKPATPAEVAAIQAAVGELDRMVSKNEAISKILDAATAIAKMAAGNVKKAA